ncbi:4-hydroxy-tetrahydrodipicolinate synthase [Ehrlichia canis]|uniref:4-hydroxy-tetrahydrodipicolinate synthase n=1 Tax=Ehrlichia canis (strain Jake) TaxID=269484 RepID=DAPA_EHRCJ|nr:4-hydroxy-tetrahydrodipicolinate synthase [Ehrlichia canis]Q3YSK1.1 RecName: Full=4-hydroxy-tetrahydrodipicolinate synthase; Short=HTPA synthase [Ehrlichia canis str. Jake]AAZ68304.1 dihydrodipicolinate synthase [Ehrlichia canis str. Jake]AUO54934.1 4-hydroxy-tetrahydrodipicolinate synthase [Ehrlichia canis]UKC53350.1 4-hydroxy-tetrahydrodipicolinate synthase [Ehrlichia canis]UKC54286.1 4-hydroxy-tetrahydrodipicolinate synthase [Ehrlichia canis]UKC55222.1 4-hydroxy-tetrahydrodipicolinate s
MSKVKLSGIFTALITPFKNDFSIDEDTFSKLIEHQISNNIHGLVPCGTTGEYSTLSFEEYCRVIELCVKVTNKRVPIIAGSGSNCTQETIKRTLYVQSLNVDAALVVVPYYNRPSDEGIFQHFKAVHDATDVPIIIYNIPQRTAIDPNDVLLARILSLPRIIGIKDATGDVSRPLNLKLLIDKEFALFTGNDATSLGFYAQGGGTGCISAVSNVIPKIYSDMHNAFFAHNIKEAMDANASIFKLSKVLFCQSNPSPTKYAMSLIKGISPTVRLPLVELTQENKLKVENMLKELNLI